MDIDSFLKKISEQLDLGKIVDGPEQIKGGLTHRMFRLFTEQGRYVIKLLNPNIMKNSRALDDCAKAEKYEELLKDNDIKAIYYLEFNDKKLQKIDGQYFYVYEWYDGKVLTDNEITKYHCKEMGKAVAKIHNIDLVNHEFVDKEKNIDFKYYVDLAKEKKSPVYEMLFDKLDVLNDSINKGNKALKKLPSYYALCHNDMDPKNVMWLGDDYRLIDLECLGYYNPYLELFELALYWSGYESCNINFDFFNAFFESYFDNSSLDKNVDWESIYYANNNRLEWLEFNIKRSLMIDCNTKEEQELGLNEVKKAMNHIVYYDKMKNEIISNMKK